MSAFRRKMIATVAIFSTATAFQLLPGSCYQFSLLQGVAAFDFCSVLNCEGGSFFNFCEPVALLVDCPNLVADGGNP